MTASDKPSFEGLGIVKKKLEGFNHMASSGTPVTSEMKRNC